ncbi:MAG: hypothetical protein AB1345_01285 [Chloroflexota bacterium]
MTTPSPIEELASEINRLQFALQNLQDEVHLREALDEIEDLQTTVNGMGQQIANLRARGYAFEKELEDQAADFEKQWKALYPNLTQHVRLQAASLQASLRPIENQMTQLAAKARVPAVARPMVNSLETAIDNLEEKVKAAQRTIHGMYDKFNKQVYQVSKHIQDIEWMLTQLSEATFQLLSTEAGIMAVKAVWCKADKEHKDDPEGVLYLTDQRIIFEQKEEVATKKVLFIATEKETVQQLKWEVPVMLAEEVTTSKRGLLKNEDHIEIRFASGAPLRMAHLHIWQDCDEWQGLINRARTKGFDKGRAIAIDEAELEKVKTAPTECPSCGGKIAQVVLRGMDSITCEFCGSVIRL